MKTDTEPWNHLSKATQLRPLNFTVSWFLRQLARAELSFPFLSPVSTFLPHSHLNLLVHMSCVSLGNKPSANSPKVLTCPWLSLGGSAVVILLGHLLLPEALRALFLSVQYCRNSAYLQQHVNEMEIFLQPFTVPAAVGRGVRNPVQFAEICVFMQQNLFFFFL